MIKASCDVDRDRLSHRFRLVNAATGETIKLNVISSYVDSLA